MSNIPGIGGYIQPGTFSRDRVKSSAVSIPGGLRLLCLIGEGLTEEILVASAAGNGSDGNSDISPTGTGDSKYFRTSAYPLVSGRTQVYLNGTSLFGLEQEIDDAGFASNYDFRLDITSGAIEMQGASIVDQGGSLYSASTLNVGNGIIPDGDCGTIKLISIVDQNTPAERWTVKCVSVTRDASGNPISGKAIFSVSGSISGQIKNSSGQPYLFHDSYKTGTDGAVSGNVNVCTDGFVVASFSDFSTATAVTVTGDTSTENTTQYEVDGDLISHGQALVGDTLCLGDGYSSYSTVISELSYSSVDDKTTITVSTDSLPTDLPTLGVEWEIRATNLFIQDPNSSYDDGAGIFSNIDIGKVIAICGGASAGTYKITKVTSSRRVRVERLSDSTLAFPDMSGTDGIGEDGLTYHILETNQVLLFGIKPGTKAFSAGDKFYIDVTSKILKVGDELKVKYIAEENVNDPEFFTNGRDLFAKHGDPSLTNTLSLAAQLAFQNGAAGLFALQAKPAIARRTSVTLFEKQKGGKGGFPACGGDAADCQADDLSIIIPRSNSGLLTGKPDADTEVHFFVINKTTGKESQIFPNKIEFYNSQLETETAQSNFVTSSDYAYSYTVVNTGTKIAGTGVAGELSEATGYFTSTEVTFTSDSVGQIIVMQSIVNSSDALLTTKTEISDYVFGSLSTKTVELVITEVVNENTVAVTANNDDDDVVISDSTDINFFIKNAENTTDTSAMIILNKSLISSGSIQKGDGLRISYVDQNDADYFDTGWSAALEKLEAIDFQILVPIPTQAISAIQKTCLAHCELMSTIANRKERILFTGAMQGLTANALIGNEEVAIEDIGILEGIQGDDAEEVLADNTEDLMNYKLSDNFTSNRCVYFYPDQFVTTINGSNEYVSGLYAASAAAGLVSATQNVAEPLTYKELVGLTLTRDKIFRPATLNSLGEVGATVLQPITGGVKVLAGRTTSNSGFVEDEEISVMFIRDRVKQVLRNSMASFIGKPEDLNTAGVMTARVKSLMSAMVSQGLVTEYKNVRVQKDKVDPRQWNVYLQFIPTYPINYVFIDIEVGI